MVRFDNNIKELPDDLINAAEYIKKKDEDRDTSHIEEIYSHKGRNLVVVNKYNNFVGEYYNEIFSDFVECMDETYYGVTPLTGRHGGDKNRVTFIFQKEPEEALKSFILYSISSGIKPTSAIPLAKKIYKPYQSEDLINIAQKISDSKPDSINTDISEIKDMMNIQNNI